MIAALQMYDWPEVQARTDAFWAILRVELRTAGLKPPDALSRPMDISSAWLDPDLVVGQTCGLPYVSGQTGQAIPIGRPCYGLSGAANGEYCSAIICHRDRSGDLASFIGTKAAINDYGSQSGCNALAAAILQQNTDNQEPFFSDVILSGAHRKSAQMVSTGQADVAAIDAVAWALFQEQDPDLYAQLRVIEWTAKTPALPFITAPRFKEARPIILSALQKAAIQSPCAIGIPDRVIAAEDGDYDPIRKIAGQVHGVRLHPGGPALGSDI